VPTRGRLLDHVGCEVKTPEAFCRRAAVTAVKFDIPYRKDPGLGIPSAFLTDP